MKGRKKNINLKCIGNQGPWELTEQFEYGDAVDKSLLAQVEQLGASLISGSLNEIGKRKLDGFIESVLVNPMREAFVKRDSSHFRKLANCIDAFFAGPADPLRSFLAWVFLADDAEDEVFEVCGIPHKKRGRKTTMTADEIRDLVKKSACGDHDVRHIRRVLGELGIQYKTSKGGRPKKQPKLNRRKTRTINTSRSLS